MLTRNGLAAEVWNTICIQYIEVQWATHYWNLHSSLNSWNERPVLVKLMANLPRMQKGSDFLTLIPLGDFLEQGRVMYTKIFMERLMGMKPDIWFCENWWGARFLMLLENKTRYTNRRSTDISDTLSTISLHNPVEGIKKMPIKFYNSPFKRELF